MGVSFLTQWGDEEPASLQGKIFYLFSRELLTMADITFQPNFPVTRHFFQASLSPRAIKWTNKNYLLPRASKSYQAYLRPVVHELEATPANKFEPRLTYHRALDPVT